MLDWGIASHYSLFLVCFRLLVDSSDSLLLNIISYKSFLYEINYLLVYCTIFAICYLLDCIQQLTIKSNRECRRCHNNLLALCIIAFNTIEHKITLKHARLAMFPLTPIFNCVRLCSWKTRTNTNQHLLLKPSQYVWILPPLKRSVKLHGRRIGRETRPYPT